MKGLSPEASVQFHRGNHPHFLSGIPRVALGFTVDDDAERVSGGVGTH